MNLSEFFYNIEWLVVTDLNRTISSILVTLELASILLRTVYIITVVTYHIYSMW